MILAITLVISVLVTVTLHSVTHHAVDSNVALPTPLLSGGRAPAVRDVLQSGCMNVKRLYISLCGNNEG